MACPRALIFSMIASLMLTVASASLAADTPAAKTKTIPASAPSTIDARPWPRTYTIDGTKFQLYRPQLDTWTGNQLKARAAMSVFTGTSKDAKGNVVQEQTYGVLWVSARTDTDKDAREVTLTNITFDRAKFPASPDSEARYLALAQKISPGTDLVVSLDQLEASLALLNSQQKVASLPVNNTPPDILFSFEPAVLILIDGEAVWKPAGVAGVERTVNTRALLLRYQGKVYLGYGSHWASAASLAGPWTGAASVPPALDQVMQKAVAANQAPASKDVPKDIADEFKEGKFPAVFVRTHAAELIVADGEPQFAAIPGTQLAYVSNTPADVFALQTDPRPWYVLISGRWFTAASNQGPWTYVAQSALPADFAKIPSDSPKSAVLASVAGTPESKEALIANSIPQTATVDKTKATFQSHYDGHPQFKSIEGTSLKYAQNSSVPIIDVPGASYYALSNGVWFVSEGSGGPWQVAVTVPPAIYSIPSSSPIHYVTYARVYGSNGNDVYVGYTPGYYGTVVSESTVVYGTGYPCNSWVGDVWYGCPTTYGYGAAFAFGAAVGWGLAFGWGWYDPWFDPWWGPWAGYYPGFYYPWAYGGAVAANVYGRWGNSVVAGTAAAWANPWTGNYGRAGRGAYYNTATGGHGYGYAGRNTNIYTGNTAAAAGGIRYNPQTGRVVAGHGAAAGNIYTGNGAAAGARTVVNTNTGQVTREAGGAARTDNGATAAGGFNSHGAQGNAAGAGYIHYDKQTGDVTHGGAVDVNGNVYAGHDGNVYKHDADGGWEKAGGNGQFNKTDKPDPSLNNDRLSRDRGEERQTGRGNFDRGSYGGNFHGRMGGMRGGFRR
jgi:hypothetical protein